MIPIFVNNSHKTNDLNSIKTGLNCKKVPYILIY